MSREIKFRAWHEEDQKMLVVVSVSYGVNLETDCTEIISIDCAEVTDGRWKFAGDHDADEVTLMQSTGLKDKNGVEIYEGDWVTAFIETPPSYFNPDDNIHLIQGRVFFDVGCFLFGNGNYLDGDHIWDLEIIGNIHENPELLENRQ